MAGLAVSARLFGLGIVRRLWSLVPGAVLGLGSVYDAFVKPYLPSEWQHVSLAVPLPLVVVLLACGLGWAALLTYHELRLQPHGRGEPVVRVEPGATYINAPGATFTVGAGSSTRRTRIDKPTNEQLTVWGVTNDQTTATSR